MKRKIALTLASAGTAVALLPLLAAFEAHVINVTAKIENALSVPLEHIRFGTVFPQEYLEKELPIQLSQSFLDEDRVDDVEYFIRQKPKCVITRNNGTEFNENDPTATGHVHLNEVDVPVIDCGPAPRPLLAGETWGVLPSLCPYLSKHERSKDGTEQENDGSLNSFHEPWIIQGHQIVWNEVHGRLTKLAGDIADNWIIDLAVPCFGGYCAQDWASFVHSHNPTADPNLYTQPIANEHKIFGCDLWVEVSCVSNASFTLFSDTSDLLPDNSPAVATYAGHPAWTASIPGATWIWSSAFVTDPTIDQTTVFHKDFTVTGAISSGTLNIATDNTYKVFVNNVQIVTDPSDNNFQLGTQDTYDLTANLQQGANTLKIEVTNIGLPGSTPTSNPGGLLYKLDVKGASCTE